MAITSKQSLGESFGWVRKTSGDEDWDVVSHEDYTSEPVEVVENGTLWQDIAPEKAAPSSPTASESSSEDENLLCHYNVQPPSMPVTPANDPDVCKQTLGCVNAARHALTDGCLICCNGGQDNLSDEFLNTLPRSIVRTSKSEMKCHSDTTVNISFRDLCRTVYGKKSQNTLTHAIHETMKHSDVIIDDWKHSSNHGIVRNRSFRAKTGAPIGPSTARMTTVEKIQLGRDYALVSTASRVNDTPFASDFVAETILHITKINPSQCTVRQYSAVHFKKPVLMLGGFIRKQVASKSVETHEIFLSLLEDLSV